MSEENENKNFCLGKREHLIRIYERNVYYYENVDLIRFKNIKEMRDLIIP